jgi:hypothetical protein
MTESQEHDNQGHVTLMVDFSNGVRKTFACVPYRPHEHEQEMGVTDVLELAQFQQPGLSYLFAERFTDRGGGEVGTIAAVDGVAAEPDRSRWAVWVNQQAAGELRRVVPSTIKKVARPLVQPGDLIVLKLVAEAQA